eukprot:6953980-Prymnesium_polylepis.2
MRVRARQWVVLRQRLDAVTRSVSSSATAVLFSCLLFSMADSSSGTSPPALAALAAPLVVEDAAELAAPLAAELTAPLAASLAMVAIALLAAELAAALTA